LDQKARKRWSSSRVLRPASTSDTLCRNGKRQQRVEPLEDLVGYVLYSAQNLNFICGLTLIRRLEIHCQFVILVLRLAHPSIIFHSFILYRTVYDRLGVFGIMQQPLPVLEPTRSSSSSSISSQHGPAHNTLDICLPEHEP
jgi:hypothetical protein